MRRVVPVLAVLLLPVSLLTEAPGAACPPRACVLLLDPAGEALLAIPGRQAEVAAAAVRPDRPEADRPDRSGTGGPDSGPPADAPAPDDRN